MADRNEQIERLRKRHRAFPDSKAFAPLADSLRQDGQVEEALSLLEDGLARFPSYLTAMVILGHTLLDANRQDHARKVLVRVLDLDPDNFVALRLLADDACQQEVWELAAPWLARLAALEPFQPQWQTLLEKACAHLPEAQDQIKGESDFATMTMVDIYMEQGYFAKALAALKLIQGRNPGRPDVKAKLVEVLAKLDEPGNQAPEGSAGRVAGDELRPSLRAQEMAAKRAREKQQFNEWIDGFQPGEGNHP